MNEAYLKFFLDFPDVSIWGWLFLPILVTAAFWSESECKFLSTRHLYVEARQFFIQYFRQSEATVAKMTGHPPLHIKGNSTRASIRWALLNARACHHTFPPYPYTIVGTGRCFCSKHGWKHGIEWENVLFHQNTAITWPDIQKSHKIWRLTHQQNLF